MLHYLLNIIILGSFLQVACQIYNRYIEGKNIESLAHNLGITSGFRDHVLAITPQLSREAIIQSSEWQ